MDNARIHHGEEILELVEPYGNAYMHLFYANWFTILSGIRLEYLPPYSPDFNPIEEAFSKVKHFIRRNGHLMESSKDGTLNGLFHDMHIAMDVVTAQDAKGYICHAGYM